MVRSGQIVFCRRLIPAVLLGGALLLGSAATADAQATRTLSSAARRLEEFNRQNEKAARDDLDREIAGRKPSREELQREAAKKAELKKSLEDLQAAYNEIASTLNARRPPSKQFVLETTDRVLRITHRLRSDLHLPEPLTQKSAAVSKQPPEISLRSLCVQIYTFLTSPIFETPAVYDLEKSIAARGTLDWIIRAAETLHKEAGTLH